jgi:mono/diheme cytochrome c family protein
MDKNAEHPAIVKALIARDAAQAALARTRTLNPQRRYVSGNCLWRIASTRARHAAFSAPTLQAVRLAKRNRGNEMLGRDNSERQMSVCIAGVKLVLTACCVWLLISSSALPDDSIDATKKADFFRQQVEPILVGRCLECHGSDRKGELDLRTMATALKGGESGAAIEPGKPDDSLLYAYVSSEEMPPKKPLSNDQIAVLKQWIEQGAYFPDNPLDLFAATSDTRAGYDWWSLQPLSSEPPPVPQEIPATWKDNPIDRFVFAKLSENDLRPSPQALPRELLRRATYDLIGLPPSPQEVKTFLAECREETGGEDRVGQKTYETLIDRLLLSPHYGEQWGRHWLDVVRFGESNGFERNVIHNNVWPFRDYVIQSFNSDKPFDRFVVEHLAGDVLAPADPQVSVGTAFLVCGPYDNVGNQDAAAAAQIRANTIDEMIRATGEAFLGLTVGCGRCHDHKFDPISQQDYYSLYGTFAGVRHGERAIKTEQSEQRKHQLTTIEEKIAETQLRIQEIAPQIRATSQGRMNDERFPPVEAKYVRFTILATNSAEPCLDELEIFAVATDQTPAHNVALASSGAHATSSGNFAGNPKHRLEHVNDGMYGNSRSWISNKVGSGWVQIELAEAQRIDRVVWGRDREEKFSDRLATSYRIEVATEPGQWHVVAASFDHLLSADREQTTTDSPLRGLSVEQTELVRSLVQRVKSLEQELDQLRSATAPPKWWVGTFQQVDGPFHVFVGGSPQRPGIEVEPASMNTLARSTGTYELEFDSAEQERRLALAKWIVADDNPLTPRVLVNRLWHYHFGTGIVSTPSDFGYMGGRPSHPELLDWLAIQLQQHDWRLKPLHRMIMLSQTYRQSAGYQAEAAKIDADSRFLWRYPPRRLSAEEIRDTTLAVADKLDPQMGGPGFRLFRYVQDNVATYHPLDKHGPETWRRAVYHHKARAMQIDLLTEFDSPDCAFSTPRRSSTTSPLQALTLMNHEFTLDMSASLASRLSEEPAMDGQVRQAFALCYSREPTDDELSTCIGFIEEHDLPAFCRVLLNSNEFIYLN